MDWPTYTCEYTQIYKTKSLHFLRPQQNWCLLSRSRTSSVVYSDAEWQPQVLSTSFPLRSRDFYQMILAVANVHLVERLLHPVS